MVGNSDFMGSILQKHYVKKCVSDDIVDLYTTLTYMCLKQHNSLKYKNLLNKNVIASKMLKFTAKFKMLL